MDAPLIFCCPADHVPDWQPRILLGMVEARSVNAKNTHNHTHTREDGGEAKERNKPHKSCRRHVGNGGDLGGKRKNRRQERVGLVPADLDNLENTSTIVQGGERKASIQG